MIPGTYIAELRALTGTDGALRPPHGQITITVTEGETCGFEGMTYQDGDVRAYGMLRCESGQWVPTGEQTGVPDMFKYTESDFGFRFGYPKGWTVSESMPESADRKGWYKDGKIIKQIKISNPTPSGKEPTSITIDLFSSTYLDIIEMGSSKSASPTGVDQKYYFDPNAHIWMYEALGGNIPPTGPFKKGADISNNTMGGLHILNGAARWGANSIVPLTARHFLVIWDDSSSGIRLQIPLVQTIVATDPEVASPVALEEQIKIIEAEKESYTSE